MENLTWIHGRHTVKSGVDIRRLLLDVRNIGATNGTFGFTGAFSGAAVADFLLGLSQSAGAAAPPGPDGVNLSTVWQGFVQDDWKVRDNLTLSIRMRYEYPATLPHHRGQRSFFDGDFPGGRLIYAGIAGYFVPDRDSSPRIVRSHRPAWFPRTRTISRRDSASPGGRAGARATRSGAATAFSTKLRTPITTSCSAVSITRTSSPIR